MNLFKPWKANLFPQCMPTVISADSARRQSIKQRDRLGLCQPITTLLS
ncbi:MAG: hypothetical protein AAFN08_07940 [Cyanobacteria bacterium J06559_3]